MWALQIVFILVCLILALFILIQPARGEGLAGAFGGVGSESFFGTKAHQHMSRLTIFLSIAALALALWINLAAKPGESSSPNAPPTPAKTTTPTK